MADLAAALKSSPERRNYAKLCRLIIDGGRLALKKVFDVIHDPANLKTALNKNITTLRQLRKRILRSEQWDLLFPPSVGAVPDSSTFDITLLSTLLREICGLHQPASGWNNKPPLRDTSLQANLVRIKWFRNDLAHKPTTEVDEASFNSHWKEVSGALVQLGLDQSEMEKLKRSEPFDEDQFIKFLAEWKRDDDSIKEQLETVIQNQGDIQEMLSKDRREMCTNCSTVGDIRCFHDDAHLLGKGCKGTKVFEGVLISSGKKVAVKKMFNGMFDLKEARRLKKLQHPNVIKCFAVEIKEDFIYLALELCEKTLRRSLEEDDFGRQGSGVSRLGCLKDLAAAVMYLHERKICHRDIKPDNILLSSAPDSCRFILADFNTARQTGANESATTQLGAIVGTNGYIAPEAYSPSEKVNIKMDIFSLGCVYFYVLTDKGHPFGSVEQPKECQARINKCKDLVLSEGDFLECSWLKPCIEDMVSSRSERRPTAGQVMKTLQEMKYSIMVDAGGGDRDTGDLLNKAKPARNQQPKRALKERNGGNEGSPKKKKRQETKPKPSKPSVPNPKKGTYQIGMLGYLRKNVSTCYGCGNKFKPNGEIPPAPQDLVAITRGKRKFWHKESRVERTSYRDSKIYYHVEEGCIEEHDPQFSPKHVIVPDDLKGYLKQEHFDFLGHSRIVT